MLVHRPVHTDGRQTGEVPGWTELLGAAWTAKPPRYLTEPVDGENVLKAT